jgi:hypothetical protein
MTRESNFACEGNTTRGAQQVLADFQLEHDGQAPSPELCVSLDRERRLLDIELAKPSAVCKGPSRRR